MCDDVTNPDQTRQARFAGPSRRVALVAVAALAVSALALGGCRSATQADSDEALVGATPLFSLEPKQIDTFVGDLHAATPDIRERILKVAHRQLGQPYDIYLLGEFPFEVDDAQPLFELGKSDCVVFVEHTYAMSLGDDWAEFFGYLQRIRYIDGRIGVATRNHYTEPQWNVNNAWIVRDVTDEIAGDVAVPYNAKANVAKFLRNSFGTELDDWIIEHGTSYLPHEHLGRARGMLQDGDLVQIVRGTPPTGDGINGRFAGAYVGHFGLVEIDDDGELWMIHSAAPAVRRERIADYAAASVAKNPEKIAAGKPQFLGFKFLAFREDAADNLKELDGEYAPIVRFAPNAPLPRE